MPDGCGGTCSLEFCLGMDFVAEHVESWSRLHCLLLACTVAKLTTRNTPYLEVKVLRSNYLYYTTLALLKLVREL